MHIFVLVQTVNENKIMENRFILVIIVLYKCRFEDSKSLQTLSNSITAAKWGKMDLVVYDNSPEYNMHSLNHKAFNIYYVPDYSNSGVSKAYNTAFVLGKQMKKKYLLLLDQDTEIPSSYCEELFVLQFDYSLIVPKLMNKNKIISPCRYILGRGSSLNMNKCIGGLNSLKQRNFLNSGSLISISLFEKVGGFDERVPLYFSDFNFFNRLKKHENSFFLLESVFYHDMSSNDETNIDQFFKRFELYCDGAFVCYRNFGGVLLMIINVVLRTLKLSLKYRTTNFIKIAIGRFYVHFIK